MGLESMGMSCSNLGMNTFQHGKPKSHRRGARSIVQQQLQGIKRESLQMEFRLFVLLFSRKYSTFRTPLLLLRSLSRRRRSSLLPPLSCPPNSPVPPHPRSCLVLYQAHPRSLLSRSPLSLLSLSRLAHISLQISPATPLYKSGSATTPCAFSITRTPVRSTILMFHLGICIMKRRLISAMH